MVVRTFGGIFRMKRVKRKEVRDGMWDKRVRTASVDTPKTEYMVSDSR
jgi:hypothetical protein